MTTIDVPLTLYFESLLRKQVLEKRNDDDDNDNDDKDEPVKK